MSERSRRISDIIPCVQDDGPRQTRRFALDADITFLQPANTLGVTVDANASGMRVIVDAPMKVGARCIARVQLADGAETHERVEVVWSQRSPRGWMVGLRFAS